MMKFDDNEKRFICGLGFPINSDNPIRIISDTVEDKDYYKFSDICNIMNEQQATIDKLDQENADLLGARIKAQEEWEKCTDKLKKKILEQQSIINEQNEAIEYLKTVIRYTLPNQMVADVFKEIGEEYE